MSRNSNILLGHIHTSDFWWHTMVDVRQAICVAMEGVRQAISVTKLHNY